MLIERAVRKKVLAQKPYRDIDYVLALDDVPRVGALRFRMDAKSLFWLRPAAKAAVGPTHPKEGLGCARIADLVEGLKWQDFRPDRRLACVSSFLSVSFNCASAVAR
jgi:hypothetical protein